jgi:hypothetical protein
MICVDMVAVALWYMQRRYTFVKPLKLCCSQCDSKAQQYAHTCHACESVILREFVYNTRGACAADATSISTYCLNHSRRLIKRTSSSSTDDMLHRDLFTAVHAFSAPVGATKQLTCGSTTSAAVATISSFMIK